MPPVVPSPPLPAPAPATTGSGRWLTHRLRRETLLMAGVCTVIALFLGVIHSAGPSRSHFVYSYAIGYSCWGLTNALRSLVLALLQRSGRAASDGRMGWPLMTPVVVLGTAVGLPLGMWLADSIYGHQSPSLLHWDSVSTRLTLTVTALAALFALFAMTTLERLAAARINAESARAEASLLELKLLQSQLEPHMLFNTLANLRVLIELDAGRAQAMLDHLIAFLRATLSASRSEQHTLAAEFARVADYLALMGCRMGPRLAVELSLPDELAGVAVPPLILQPLVENAIRHGLEPQVEGGRVEVAARREGQCLLLTVRDDGVGLQQPASAAPSAAGSGFGLEQVRRRLAALHGSAARLTLQAAGADAVGGTLATLELPWPST